MSTPRRYTQHSRLKLWLEKIVKSNVYFYKISFEIKKHLGSLFHEEDLSGIDKLGLTGNEHCIDIGANVGQSIEFFRKRFKHIYAFEPNPGNFSYLKKKYANRSVDVFPYAIGSRHEKNTLYVPYYRGIALHHTASFIKEECYDTLGEFLDIPAEKIRFEEFVVETRRLDEFSFDHVAMIKIDAEGYEKEVIQGFGEILNRDVVMIIEKSNRSYDFVKEYLSGYGFKGYAYSNGAFVDVSDDTLNVYWSKKPLK